MEILRPCLKCGCPNARKEKLHSAKLTPRRYSRDEKAAWSYVVKTLWPIGFACPKCGRRDRITAPKSRPEARYCGRCEMMHSVRAQLVVKQSTIPMTKVLKAVDPQAHPI